MAFRFFTIKEIPDISLGKYDSLAKNGVSGVLELHRSFLQQLHQKSMLTEVSFHLLYRYKKSLPYGQKLQIYLIAKGEDSAVQSVLKILEGTALSQYFRFEAAEGIDLSDSYPYCSTLTKQELVYEGVNGKSYYSVPLWTANSTGRLYEMFRMMEALDENCIFRIDIKAVNRGRTLRKALQSKPIPELCALRDGTDRDYGADGLIKSYEELLQAVESTPHFITDIFVFGGDPETNALILSTAASEATEKGDFHISAFKGGFSPLSFIDGKDIELYSLSQQPFLLSYTGGRLTLQNQSLDCKDAKALYYLKNLFTLCELLPLFRLPCLYDGESISIRKETAALPITDKNALRLGLDTNKCEVGIPLELFPKHGMISGVPGSGKTNTMHHITHTLWSKHKIPFLVLEPAKKEYRALCNHSDMSEVRLFSPGADTAFPLHINPFEFAKGLTVSEHIGTLCQVFEGAFPLESPMPFLLENAIEAVYSQKGWQSDTRYTEDTDLEFPTMSMLYEELEAELTKTTYSGEVRGNLESALKVRIGSLLRREMGDVFDVSCSSLAPEMWLKVPAIVELEGMGQGPANFLTLMLCSLIRECLKAAPGYNGGDVRHIIFIEEAHNLIGTDSQLKSGEGANPKTAATAFIVKMLAEVRALKEGVIIADQLPSALAQEVIKNTGLKIALRLTAADDRAMLCNSMSANSAQAEDMATFKTGEALISYEKLQRPFKMRVSEWCGDKKNKNELTAPKSDGELLEIVKNTDGYKEGLSKSIDAEFKKLTGRFNKLLESEQQVIAALELYRHNEEYYRQCCENLDILTAKAEKILSKSRQTALKDPEYVELLSEITSVTEQINGAEKMLENALSVQEITDSAELIEKLISFGGRVISKLTYFNRLGASFTDSQKELFLKDMSTDRISESTKKLLYMRTELLENTVNIAAVIYDSVCPVYPLPEAIAKSIKQFAKLCGITINFEF